MPKNIYKYLGPDVISFLKKEGSNYVLKSREIRVLYRGENGGLYIRSHKGTKRFIKVKYSKNKKIGLYVVK